MPTGVALRDPQQQLFAAAERVLMRDGAGALTSRAVTEEAGCAKGVLHRHFADFDDFLAQLIEDRTTRLEDLGAQLDGAIGHGTVTGNVTAALSAILTPLGIALVALLFARDALRARLAAYGLEGMPILEQGTEILASYLAAEQQAGRVARSAEPATLALTLVGTAHMLTAGEERGIDEAALARVVAETLTP